eukprot:15461850-Alexandrium_andersonii.AAC.1
MPEYVWLRFRISGHLNQRTARSPNQRTARSPAEQKQTNAEFALQVGRDDTKSSNTHRVFQRICP